MCTIVFVSRNQSRMRTFRWWVLLAWRSPCTNCKRLQFFNSSLSAKFAIWLFKCKVISAHFLCGSQCIYGICTNGSHFAQVYEQRKKNTNPNGLERYIAPSMSYGTLFPCYLKYKQINRTNKCSRNDNNETSNKIVFTFLNSMPLSAYKKIGGSMHAFYTPFTTSNMVRCRQTISE